MGNPRYANGQLRRKHRARLKAIGGECGIAEGLEYESAQFGLMFSTQDMREGTAAFLERRKPEFRNC